jgi:hypothetical protein
VVVSILLAVVAAALAAGIVKLLDYLWDVKYTIPRKFTTRDSPIQALERMKILGVGLFVTPVQVSISEKSVTALLLQPENQSRLKSWVAPTIALVFDDTCTNENRQELHSMIRNMKASPSNGKQIKDFLDKIRNVNGAHLHWERTGPLSRPILVEDFQTFTSQQRLIQISMTVARNKKMVARRPPNNTP